MTATMDAIYEAGQLRLLDPLLLPERKRHPWCHSVSLVRLA
jgi:hypothetical protein